MYYKLKIYYTFEDTVFSKDAIVSKTKLGIREIITKTKIPVVDNKFDVSDVRNKHNLFTYNRDITNSSPATEEEINIYIDTFNENSSYVNSLVKKQQQKQEEKEYKKQQRIINKKVKQKIKTARTTYFK